MIIFLTSVQSPTFYYSWHNIYDPSEIPIKNCNKKWLCASAGDLSSLVKVAVF